MHIATITVYKLQVPYFAPLKVAIGEINGAHNIAIKITTDSGLIGWGEASPCAYITGDTQATNYQTAQQLAQLLLGKDPTAITARMAEINAYIVGEPSIRSAFDIALYDIAAKAANMPLYQYLGGERREVRTDITIGLQATVEDTVAKAANILEQNFDAIKLKVGRPGDADIAHVKAVRELAGDDIHIKIDANQGWDYPTAVANLNAMAPLNLQYCEQPLAVWDYQNMARLRHQVTTPLCADESLFTDKDAQKLVAMGAADYLNIKLGKAGGINTGLKINAIAESVGSRCMIGCFGESRLALSAAAHLVMARPNICFVDLDSVFEFKTDPVMGGVQYDKHIGGVMQSNDEPGHGASFDETMLTDAITITDASPLD